MKIELLISVVIPVKNGAYWLESQRKAFLSQTLIEQTEFIYIDSGSTDNSVGIIKGFLGAKLIEIPSNEFNHGATRNLGVQHSGGQFVVMTVQDARPSSELWLQHLLDGFVDETVAGVCGQQAVPHDLDKNPIEWFRSFSEPGIKVERIENELQFSALSPEEKKAKCSWDNVTAIYKRKALLDIPFRTITFGEDAWWARDALFNGHSIAYNTQAKVFHYHHEQYSDYFRRTIAETYLHYKAFGLMPDPRAYRFTIKEYLSCLKTLALAKGVRLKDKIIWGRYTFVKRKAGVDAAVLVRKALELNEGELERIYNMFCKTSPMASARVI